jgi:hypothetical protein
MMRRRWRRRRTHAVLAVLSVFGWVLSVLTQTCGLTGWVSAVITSGQSEGACWGFSSKVAKGAEEAEEAEEAVGPEGAEEAEEAEGAEETEKAEEGRIAWGMEGGGRRT